MPERTDSHELPFRPVPPDLLVPLHEVNERCLELITLIAKLDPHEAPFTLITPLRSLLRGTKPVVRRRAARQPFALIDMEFRDRDWWHAVKSKPARAWKERSWRGSSPKRPAVQLAHTTLMLAWHMTRADPAAAAIVFGMQRDVVRTIATLPLSDIDVIAERHFRHLRPRWEDRPDLWRELLVAAHADDEAAMRDFAVRALQLLAGDIVPRS
jgi:hypothetical protein